MKSPDLKKLKTRAFGQFEWIHRLVPVFGGIPREYPDYHLLSRAYAWLLAPITLWPINLETFMRHALDRAAKGKPLDEASRLICEMLGDPPDDSVQETVASQEHLVRSGSYESMVNAQNKFDFLERHLSKNKKLRQEWSRIVKAFPVREYRDAKGIIRRRMVQERSFRGWSSVNWLEKKQVFWEVFDAFCHRWNLYGMERNRPLVLKLSVNLTPYGTMIFVPAYWSFDPKRDLNWRSISRLHRVRGVARQGPKLGANKEARRAEAIAAKRLWLAATKAGIKGQKRLDQVMAELGWDPRTDPSRLRRLLKSTSKSC